jgi:hypothetical protein
MRPGNLPEGYSQEERKGTISAVQVAAAGPWVGQVFFAFPLNFLAHPEKDYLEQPFSTGIMEAAGASGLPA